MKFALSYNIAQAAIQRQEVPSNHELSLANPSYPRLSSTIPRANRGKDSKTAILFRLVRLSELSKNYPKLSRAIQSYPELSKAVQNHQKEMKKLAFLADWLSKTIQNYPKLSRAIQSYPELPRAIRSYPSTENRLGFLGFWLVFS